jgi:hypothetical protein
LFDIQAVILQVSILQRFRNDEEDDEDAQGMGKTAVIWSMSGPRPLSTAEARSVRMHHPSIPESIWSKLRDVMPVWLLMQSIAAAACTLKLPRNR